jgi:hypothetical protein
MQIHQRFSAQRTALNGPISKHSQIMTNCSNFDTKTTANYTQLWQRKRELGDFVIAVTGNAWIIAHLSGWH